MGLRLSPSQIQSHHFLLVSIAELHMIYVCSRGRDCPNSNTEVMLQCVDINLAKWMQGSFYYRPSSENTFCCAERNMWGTFLHAFSEKYRDIMRNSLI